jgi:hypothetical protein
MRHRHEPPPGPYPWIRAWGWMMGSFPYYIESQIERAQRTGAPANAIYEHHDAGSGGNGTWATTATITNEATKLTLRNEFGPLPEDQP